MRCSRATKKMEGGVKVLVLLPQILPGYVYPALFVEKGKFLHLTPGFRKENHFKESGYAEIRIFKAYGGCFRKAKVLIRASCL
jgi:hypothetical protein